MSIHWSCNSSGNFSPTFIALELNEPIFPTGFEPQLSFVFVNKPEFLLLYFPFHFAQMSRGNYVNYKIYKI